MHHCYYKKKKAKEKLISKTKHWKKWTWLITLENNHHNLINGPQSRHWYFKNPLCNSITKLLCNTTPTLKDHHHTIPWYHCHLIIVLCTWYLLHRDMQSCLKSDHLGNLNEYGRNNIIRGNGKHIWLGYLWLVFHVHGFYNDMNTLTY